MIRSSLFSVIAALLIIATGCISEWDKMLETKTLKSEITDATEYFTEKTTKVKIEKYRKTLTVNLDINLPGDFPYPLDSNGKKQAYTDFYFTFYFNGKMITIDPYFARYYPEGKIDKEGGYLRYMSNQRFLPEKNHFSLDIPMFMFHNIPAGDQELEVEIEQRSFFREEEYDYETGEYAPRTKTNKSLIKGRLKFTVEIPEIHKTTLIGGNIILRDDETFSPTGMDFSFRQGYPDIYWEVFFPAEDDEDFNNRCCRSGIEYYATSYNGMDTFRMFHYEPEDKMIIGVYDHDDTTRDDFIGTWFGSTGELTGESGKYMDLSFDNITSFKIKAEYNGIINPGKK
ncbi:MAG: hypothetical protein ABIJ16_03830 [Bacteroidota bacterium]